MNDELKVQYLMGRVLYERFCEFKGFKPRPQPYSDPAMLDYAVLAVDMLGYDDSSIEKLQEKVK